MKIVRYTDSSNAIRYGALQPDNQVFELSGDIFTGLQSTGKTADVRKLLAPLAPTAILCIGLNYRLHAQETNTEIPKHPVLFMKSTAAVQNPNDPILIPTHLKSEKVDYECELVVAIGKTCKNTSKENALDYVLGYMCGNDVSARDWQKHGGGGQWCRGKTFDTFAPLGPCLVTPDEIPNPNALGIKTLLNGQVMQQSNTNDMIFNVAEIIAFLSGSTTLLPGTVIFTGTPSGVGMARNPHVWLKPGDNVSVEIEKIGSLTNPVALEK